MRGRTASLRRALPEGQKLDGVSLLPLLEGEDADWPARRLVIQAHRGNRPVPFHHIAVLEPEWKLVRPTGFGPETDPPPVPFELYRIAEDPGEARDLAAEHPEKVNELKNAYEAWLADVSSTREDNYAPPRIVIGHEAEPVSDLSIQDWRVPDGVRGWGEGGTWQVSFARSGRYEAKVRWTEPIGEREITLCIGEHRFEGLLADGDAEVHFPNLELAEGDAEISVELSGGIDRDSVLRFVSFRKK